MSTNNSAKAILYAFLANLGVVLAKTFAALWTGSGSLLAEAVHSFADCGNQILLFIGMKRSAKQPTSKHPMGFSRESYVWSMMVAFTLFSVGGVFSIHEGFQRYQNPHVLENTGVALFILLIACGMEFFSLKGALAAIEEEKGEASLWQWFKQTHSSELMVVIGEDLAALLGLLIAFLMLTLSMLTDNTAFDAVGSMMIGLLLIVVALLIGRELHSLILGESADEIKDYISDYLSSKENVVQVFNIWAINHGNHVMVAIKAELNPDLKVSEAVQQINLMESEIKLNQERVRWIFFEIDSVN